MLFSYGSGCAASLFFVRVRDGYKSTECVKMASDFWTRLNSRTKISPAEFDSWMSHREANFGKKGVEPTGEINHLFPGTFYLTKVDSSFRRFYTIHKPCYKGQSLSKKFNWSGSLKP